MEAQCELLLQTLQVGQVETPITCICVEPSSPLARQREYAARLSLSCYSDHGASEFHIKHLDPQTPEYEFVSRALQNELVRHRVRYDSDDYAERPQLAEESVYRLFNPELVQRYNLER